MSGDDGQIVKTVNASWVRFAFLFGVVSIFPAFLIKVDIERRSEWPIAAAFGLMNLSLVLFMLRGWMRLRKASAIRQIPITDVCRIRELLVGPKSFATIWFACATLAGIAVMVVWAILSRAS